MIIYSGTISKFSSDVLNGEIADIIKSEFEKSHFLHSSDSEYRAWSNSLLHMDKILNSSDIDQNVHVAIEYQIPATSKRVDFIVSGKDENDVSNAVIIELKQWEKAEKTSREDLVTTFLNGSVRSTTHTSYQAYSYAKTIENYNEYVQEKTISLYPCVYLHNYSEEFRSELDNPLYESIVKEAPLYLKKDGAKLREFIKQHIRKADNGELLYQIENGRIKPSKALQDVLGSMLKGNKEFVMIDEQKVVYSTIKKLVEKALINGKKYTIIVEGGPGTGKSVVAINLLATFRDKVVNYVTKNSAPRNVYFAKLRQSNYKNNYIKNLFKGSGSYYETDSNTFDCLIVDEAHRLNQKSGMFSNLGENQVKEIINASRVSVFFIDEDQIVTTKDFGSINEIKRCAKELDSNVYSGDEFKLSSQFRCNGSDGYIAFLDHILQIRETANFDGFEMDYDLRLYDDPIKMKNDLSEINKKNNKARMIAGYCYEWVTKGKSDPNLYDIQLGNEFKAKWNFDSTQTWAIDEDSFDQVGCIHTAQGLEFDYVGIIIGKDLICKENKVITDYNARAKSDASLKGVKGTKNYELADRIIRNTYKTLLSRGQKGCFIYCEDKALHNYLKTRIKDHSR